MPGFDGTGPLGKGPMTGRALGYCLLRDSDDRREKPQGLVDIGAVPVAGGNIDRAKNEKEVIKMPLGDGTGPTGMGPMTGRAAGFCAGYLVPGYRNPAVFGARRTTQYGTPIYGAGYPTPRAGWFGRWFGRGFRLSRGFGRGRGRGHRGGWADLRYY